MNNTMTIHFFRNSTLEKIDYSKVLDFFEELPNFTVYYTNDDVDIEYEDKAFNFKYHYLITKQSKVSHIYKLDSMYSNINMLMSMPILIPNNLAKDVFNITQKLCKIFQLGYYHDLFNDVKAFNIVDLLVFFRNQRKAYIDENGLQGKITYDADKLTSICKFQSSVKTLEDYYHNEVTVNYVYPVVDKKTGQSGMTYDWRIGTPIVFAPYVDYINILDVDDGYIIIKREKLLEIIGKYCDDVKNFLPDMYIVNGKKAKVCRRELKKIRKAAELGKDFKILSLSDVIEE
ncbi:MAG: hypothetical protein WCR33_04595 [Bacilli bacterium]